MPASQGGRQQRNPQVQKRRGIAPAMPPGPPPQEPRLGLAPAHGIGPVGPIAAVNSPQIPAKAQGPSGPRHQPPAKVQVLAQTIAPQVVVEPHGQSLRPPHRKAGPEQGRGRRIQAFPRQTPLVAETAELHQTMKKPHPPGPHF